MRKKLHLVTKRHVWKIDNTDKEPMLLYVAANERVVSVVVVVERAEEGKEYPVDRKSVV